MHIFLVTEPDALKSFFEELPIIIEGDVCSLLIFLGLLQHLPSRIEKSHKTPYSEHRVLRPRFEVKTSRI